MNRPRTGSPMRLGKPVIDNYWQTETGWPALSAASRVMDMKPVKRFGSPGLPEPRLQD
jgi:propionyl-CoA synthetase